MNPDRLRLKILHDPCDLLDMVLRESPEAAEALVESVGRRRIVRELNQSFLDWEYLGETLSLLGERAAKPPVPQDEVDACLLGLTGACHRTLVNLGPDDPVRAWLSERGVTDDQIIRHRIGVFGGVLPPQIAASAYGVAQSRRRVVFAFGDKEFPWPSGTASPQRLPVATTRTVEAEAIWMQQVPEWFKLPSGAAASRLAGNGVPLGMAVAIKGSCLAALSGKSINQ